MCFCNLSLQSIKTYILAVHQQPASEGDSQFYGTLYSTVMFHNIPVLFSLLIINPDILY